MTTLKLAQWPGNLYCTTLKGKWLFHSSQYEHFLGAELTKQTEIRCCILRAFYIRSPDINGSNEGSEHYVYIEELYFLPNMRYYTTLSRMMHYMEWTVKQRWEKIRAPKENPPNLS